MRGSEKQHTHCSHTISAFLIVSALCFSGNAQAQRYVSAEQFSGEYAQELRAKQEEKILWQVKADGTMACAIYREKESGLKSDFAAFYMEAGCTVIRTSPADIENTARLSYGFSGSGTEQWDVDGIEYQTNDLSLSRFSLDVSAGKILYSSRYKPLHVVPYVTYGFRYLEFERSDFNVLNLILIRDAVTEEYYIHLLGAGLKAEYTLNDRWSVGGWAQCSYPFYSVADNSALGSIRGTGGLCIDGALQMHYRFSPAWRISGSGEVKYQGLYGGSHGDVIWPDNQLLVIGGNLAVKYTF
jgi:hypothetical protein